MPGTRDDAHAAEPDRESPDPVSDVVRWAAFSCALVPLVLLMCGRSFGGAAGSAAGLVALTCACHALLRRSERAAGRAPRAVGRGGAGRRTDRGEQPAGALEEDLEEALGGALERVAPPVSPHRGRHGRTGTGTHRGARHPGASTYVD
ncbi:MULTISPECIES: hypothetical protein [Streptomyces]|uniref:hypothetical protein n=1 Tax=Streptomyces TaxID=1883 RepID=UPI001C8EF678|nr:MULTISPECIES: hypothetical protein [Streptomyces]UBI38715.1 hypothetical protein K7I03_21140 [Streptomyces mobaraensis]UKW31295.1 hypothetical protein MCU78_21090 [Streptomyces sp. TYQ1024]